MRARSVSRIVLGACLTLLCAVLIPGLPVAASTASDEVCLANDERCQGEQAPTRASVPQADEPSFWFYLPLIMNRFGPGLHGRVTYMGKPAADIALKLYFHDGATWSTVAATTTGVDGFYVFPPPPSLAPGQKYRVGFGPNQDPTGNPSYVYRWYGPDITSYVAGDAVPAGSNDIADVKLLWPPANYMATQLPEQFDWQQRNLGPESYQWVLFNPSSPSTVWRTDLLGDVGSYLLPGLPTGFNPGFRYGWYVNAHSAANGYVTSYYVRQITFVAAPASPVGSSSQPRGLEAPEDLLGSVPSTER